MAARFSAEALQQKYGETTVWTADRILDPMKAIQKALANYQLYHLRESPRNTSFRINWFPQKRGIILPRTFVLFKRPASSELNHIHLWHCSLLDDAFKSAQGNYLETEDSSIAMFQGR